MTDLFGSNEETPKPGQEASPDSGAEGPTFEAALKQLEGAVEQLEAGDLALTDALKLFEEGLKASNQCRSRLEQAKQKVEALVARNDGSFQLRDIDPGDGEDEDE